jgi:hypothetical protein
METGRETPAGGNTGRATERTESDWTLQYGSSMPRIPVASQRKIAGLSAYSDRNAITGSTDIARIAGAQQATPATAAIIKIASP